MITEQVKPKPKFAVGDIVCCESTDANDMPQFSKGTIQKVITYASGKFAYDVLLSPSRFLIRHWQEDGQIVNGVMLQSPLYKDGEPEKKKQFS